MTATATPYVKATFDRWLEDQLEDKGISKEQLAASLALSSEQLTRRFNKPSLFSGEEFFQLSLLLEKDWYEDMILAFPKELGEVLDNITINQGIDFAKHNGKWFPYDDLPPA